MSDLLRADTLKACNKLVLSTRSAHAKVHARFQQACCKARQDTPVAQWAHLFLQEKWKLATAHCEELLDVLRPAAQKYDLSADLPSDLGALCWEAGETAYLQVRQFCHFTSAALRPSLCATAS